MKISTIIVDDEPLARARLERFIESMNEVDLLAVGQNGGEAIELAKEHKPDVLLLDIEMPRINGLQAAEVILRELAEPPAIIFCTAHDSYALDAFSTNAVGYLLKPISFEQLNEQLLRAQRLTQLQLNRVQESVAAEDTVKVSQAGYLAKLPVSDILYFRSEGKSVVAGLADKEIIVDYSLKLLEQKFDEQFIRLHRSTMINKKYLGQLSKNGEGRDIVKLLHSDMEFIVSRRHLSAVRAYFK